MSATLVIPPAQHAVVDALRSFDSIDLDELNAYAELQTRVDRKYIVPPHAALAIIDSLPASTRCLVINETRASHYRSVYYDTPDRASFRATATRRRHRFKVRKRAYVGSALRTVEVKTRNARGLTVKNRLTVDDSTPLECLTSEGLAYVRSFIGDVASALAPVIQTEYRRSTLTDAIDHARVTIDFAVSYGLPSHPTHPLVHAIIIETKSAARSTTVDRALWANGFRPRSISKFGLAMALADPSLPANKWNRVLRNFTDWQPDSAVPIRPDLSNRWPHTCGGYPSAT